MAEGIGHESKFTPLVGRDRFFYPRSSGDSRMNRRLDFINHKVEVDRRPMPFVSSPLQRRIRRFVFQLI